MSIAGVQSYNYLELEALVFAIASFSHPLDSINTLNMIEAGRVTIQKESEPFSDFMIQSYLCMLLGLPPQCDKREINFPVI